MAPREDVPTHAHPIETEVRANVLSQPLIADAPHVATVADLNLPDSLLTRITDRIIRATFEERHRNVFDDRPGRSSTLAIADSLVDRECWHPLRGYRPVLSPPDHPWPEVFPSHDDPPELRRAAEHVARRLAFDTLPVTLAHVCTTLAPLLHDAAPDAQLDLLRRAGLPTDLLGYFTVRDTPLLAYTTARLELGAPPDLHPADFRFSQTLPGFRAIDEAGAQAASCIRMQATRPDHWNPSEGGGPGSGDNLDVLSNLIRTLPDIPFLVAVEACHAAALRDSFAGEGINADRVTLLPVPKSVSQWAQDNLKAGLVASRPAALLPRFASRAEDGAKLDTGDTAALISLADHLTTAHSPLHFQGGNVLLIVRPGGERLLLIGEAEIARNVALGLTPAQAEDALRIEMGADAALVLPAVGFHLDTEFTTRTVNAESIAFVPDEDAAARIILRTAVRAMDAARLFSPAEARAFLTFLDYKNDEQFVAKLGGLLARLSDNSGNLPGAFASILRSGLADSGPANTQRMLTALDVIASHRPRPWEPSLHPHAQAYFRSLRRLAADRRELVEVLSRNNFRVVPVPSLSAGGNRSASVINAVHFPARTLVPVRNGFLKPLDDAAIGTLRRHLGPDVQLTPIPVAESERRGGALHCSVAVFPAVSQHNQNK